MSSSSGALFASLVVILTLCTLLPGQVEGFTARERKPNPRSCREANMCCQGQNNTCFVLGDRVDMSEDSQKCYCDSNCLIMGDCCTDYHYHCRSVNCEVSDWEEWSECDNPCGYGARRRTRGVAVYPDNGGTLCPTLKQRRACVGYETEICAQNLLGDQVEEKSEQARILPIKFGYSRTLKKYDPWKGILKNLYSKYFNKLFTRATYRAQFEVVSSHYGCAESDWAKYMSANHSVCVECQPIAMNKDVGMRCLGHGVFGALTRWTAVDVPHCHGTWKMTSKHQPEVCDYDIVDEDRRNFIFI